VQIVLNTDPEVGDLREQLGHIYGSIYVPYAMKNPGYTPPDVIE
jgi:Sybindin-like family